MIITADAGVLVRATSRSNGPARRLLQKIAGNPSHQLAVSPYILGEVGKTLAYSKLQRILQITPEEIYEHVSFLRHIARVVEPEIGMPVVLTDPKDDPIVYAAIAAASRKERVRAPCLVFFGKSSILDACYHNAPRTPLPTPRSCVPCHAARR